MVLHVINIFHSSLNCPLAVLYKFLEYYSTFDWDKYCIAFNGLVLISALPEIDVVLLHDCNKLLLTEEFLRSAREVLLPPAGVVETKNLFPVKFLNILDPLRDDNNLGRSVSKGNRYRIKSALSYGFQRLSDILILPPEELRAGLERFFNNTLERNGKGKRVDVLIPVPPYGSESSVTKNDNIDVLSGIKYGLWLNDYAMKSYPVWPAMSVPGQIWNTGRGELGLNIQYDQNPYCYVDESLSCSVDSAQVLVNQTVEEKWKLRKKPFSTDSPRAPQLNNLNINDKGKARGMFEEKWESRCLQLNNAACFEERRKLRSTPFAYNSRAFWQTNAGSQHDKWRSRGTVASVDHHYGPLLSNSVSGSSGTCVFIPLRENLIFDEDEVKQEIGKSLAKANEEESEILGSLASTPKESSISSDIGERSCSIKYSMNEFPLLHGSKPIPIRSPPLAYLKDDQVKETSVSFDSTEFGSCKPSSPASLSFSEAGKQSDSSDVSVFLDALSELTSTVRISEEDKVSLKSEENKVVSVESLPLTDESEFPPLACPPKPVIPLCKKEFPPLRACLRSQKKKKKNKGRK
ncbi:uncharacterized protein LOC141605586 [Silene latifolia]|uniref:uncharacterized protein LOC141605586 n=1 Tax=Silene latifolia TaxID=37657 RepID=UPI003D77D495